MKVINMADEEIEFKCKKCGKHLTDEEIITTNQEFSASLGDIIVGYCCTDCGNEESY